MMPRLGNPSALPPLVRPPSGNLTLAPVFASALLLLPRNVDSSPSRHFGTSPSTSGLKVLESVMNLCKNGSLAKAGDALRYFKIMVRLNPLPSTPCFVQLLGAAVRMKHYAAAIHVIERMDSLGLSRNVYVLNILINCLCHLKTSDLGFSVLSKMFKIGLEPSVVTLNTLLNGLCQEGKIERALTLVEEMWGTGVEADVFTCGVIVKGLCRASNTSTAVQFMRNMEERGCELNAVMYSTIIDSYCKEGLLSEAFGFLDCMSQQGIQPDVRNYGTLIHGLGCIGDWKQAKNLLEKMIDDGIHPDVISYNSFILCLCRCGQWEEAQVQLSEMLRGGTRPDYQTFTIILNALCKHGMTDKAKFLLDTMIEMDIEPDVVSYNSLIYGYCLQNQMDDAASTFYLMTARKCNPDVVIYSTLINGYFAVKRVDKAMSHLQEMLQKGLVPSISTYSCLMDGFFLVGNPSVAHQLFYKMLTCNHIDQQTYSVMLNGLCKYLQVDKALALFQQMEDVDIVHCTILINGLCEAEKLGPAMNLFNSLDAKGLRPDVVTFGAIIKGLCKAGQIREACELFHNMKEKGCHPDGVVYNIIIRALLEDGHKARAMIVLVEMTEKGFSADASTAKILDASANSIFKSRKSALGDKFNEVIKEFDIDGDQRISKDKFVTGFTKRLEEAKIAMDKRTHLKTLLRICIRRVFQFFQPFIQKEEEECKPKKKIVEEILAHVHTKTFETLFTENGTPVLPAIRRQSISQPELKELMMGIKFGDIPLDMEEVVLKVIEVFDRSGDRQINEEEFVTGLASLLDTSGEGDKSQAPKLNTSQDDFCQRTWEETDKLVDEGNGKGDVEKLSWIWVKSISLLLLGFIIVLILAEPLISSVQSFSKSAGLPSAFFSFMLVPLATNARGATMGIKAARHKKAWTTSRTFSEIYGEVFMSNMLGFCILLSLIYAHDLTWEFSAEVLVVLIVCGEVGVIASFRSTFPVRTSILAYFVVPWALLLVYVLDDVLNYPCDCTHKLQLEKFCCQFWLNWLIPE